MTAPEDPRADPCSERPIRFLSWCRHCLAQTRALRATCRILFAVLVLLLVAFVYLNRVGFPDAVNRLLVKEAAAKGYELHLTRIRLHLTEGMVAERVLIYASPEDQAPLIEADRVSLGFDPLQWIGRRSGLERVTVTGGKFRLSPAGVIRGADDPRVILLDDIRGRVRLETEGVKIESVTASLAGIPLTIRGFIVRDAEPAPPSAGQADPAPAPVMRPRTLEATAGKMGSWLPRIIQQLNAAVFDQVPEARVDFLVHPRQVAMNDITVRATGGSSRVRGVHVDGWSLHARLHGWKLELPGLVVRDGGRKALLTGSLDLDSQIVEARVESDLAGRSVVNFLPAEWRDKLAESGTHLAGPLEATLQFGPAPLSKWNRALHGQVRLARADIGKVWFEEAGVPFQWNEPWLTLSNWTARIGRKDHQGPADGTLRFNFANGTYDGNIRCAFDPHALMPILDSNQVRLVRTANFEGKPPVITGRFKGVRGDYARFVFDGSFRSTNHVFRGTSISAFTSDILISNRLVRFEPMRILRDEGEVNGWLEQDQAARLFRFDLDSSIDPKSLARIVGPVTENISRHFTFRGPARFHAKGAADYGDRDDTDFRLTVSATNAAFQWLEAERLSFSMHGKPGRYKIRELEGVTYGGAFEGEVDVFKTEGESNMSTRIRASWSDVDFDAFATSFRQKKLEPTGGRLTGNIEYTRVLGEGRGDTMKGSGLIRIREGTLYRIRLFGGLSRYLAKIFPGFGFATQSDLKCPFEMRDRGFHTERAELRGTFLDVEAKGSVYLNEELDFLFKAKPLDDTAVGDAFRFLTFPIQNFLKFKLEGTVSNPEWRPASWPAELLRLFEGGDDEEDK